MNKLLSLSLVALLAGASFAADAAPRDDRDRHGRGYSSHDDRGRHHDRRHDNRGRHQNRGRDDNRHWRGDDRRHDNRHHSGYRPGAHRHHNYGRHHGPRYVHPRGYRPHHWARGHYLPRGYYGSSYYVDYRPYRLPPPPYGHRWVRVDNDVFLVAVATGLIADTIYGLFY